MFKKIFAAKRILASAAAAVIAISMSGCSKYEMTEEDLALQESLVGFWAADNSTGYNEFDENGKITKMTAVQFTDDFHYLLYYYYSAASAEEPSYVATNRPVSYTIENGKFRVDVKGLASYAAIRISDDGYTMSWITDEKTDTYIKFSDEEAADLGFPEYDPEMWKNLETASDISEEETGSSEEAGGEETGSEE